MVPQLHQGSVWQFAKGKRTLGLNIFFDTAVKYGYRSQLNMDAGVLPKKVVSNEEVTVPRTAVVNTDEAVSSLARFAASSGDSSEGQKSISGPKRLLSGAVRKGDGIGPVVDLGEYCSKLLVVTLGITDVVERTGLTVSVW
jgi:hypothetical protein